MLPNIHPQTGIAYGCIYLNNLDGEVIDVLCFTCGQWENPYAKELEYAGRIKGVYQGITYEVNGQYVFITESPLVGLYPECSPCCPNAGDLDGTAGSGIQCYDIPADWRWMPPALEEELQSLPPSPLLVGELEAMVPATQPLSEAPEALQLSEAPEAQPSSEDSFLASGAGEYL